MTSEARARLVDQHGQDVVALAEEQVAETADGEGLVVRLASPVKVGNAEVDRIGLAWVRVKHLRRLAGMDGADITLAILLARRERDRLAIDEIDAEVDQVAVLLAVHQLLGKYQARGRTFSSSSRASSEAGPPASAN